MAAGSGRARCAVVHVNDDDDASVTLACWFRHDVFLCDAHILCKVLPSLVKRSFLGQLGQPSPKRCRREANAIVVITFDLFYQDTSESLDVSLARLDSR
jgi:hypothetical protein